MLKVRRVPTLLTTKHISSASASELRVGYAIPAARLYFVLFSEQHGRGRSYAQSRYSMGTRLIFFRPTLSFSRSIAAASSHQMLG
jgi:hypothetical protein